MLTADRPSTISSKLNPNSFLWLQVSSKFYSNPILWPNNFRLKFYSLWPVRLKIENGQNVEVIRFYTWDGFTLSDGVKDGLIHTWRWFFWISSSWIVFFIRTQAKYSSVDKDIEKLGRILYKYRTRIVLSRDLWCWFWTISIPYHLKHALDEMQSFLFFLDQGKKNIKCQMAAFLSSWVIESSYSLANPVLLCDDAKIFRIAKTIKIQL